MAIPTETVWGIACNPFNQQAVQRFYQVKKRDSSKPSQVLCASLEHALQLCQPTDQQQQQLLRLQRYMPGPLTVVVPAAPQVPAWVAPNGKVGVRIPDHPVTLAFLQACGGHLLASSLNENGQPPALTREEALALHHLYDALLEGEISHGLSSTVYDLQTHQILRQGPLSMQDIEQALHG